ncbi:hypothetical protein VTI74DRAFT_6795 [Chaetomium olivicolor]
MGHLTNDEFFTKLTDLFHTRKSQDHGAIYLTQKRLTYPAEEPSPTSPQPLASTSLDLSNIPPSKPLPLIIRATNGKSKARRAAKVKLSTVVQPEALDEFYARYAEVCRAGMGALKPRDRTKRKAKAKKRKGGAASAPAS